MVTVINVEPNITDEENEENLRRTLAILQNIADDLAETMTEGEYFGKSNYNRTKHN